MKAPVAVLVWLPLVLVAACRGTGPAGSTPGAAPEPPLPWTTAFQHEAVLVADEITIEGPKDLLAHVALRQDPETSVYLAETRREGLYQELSARPQVGAEVHGQIDAWSLAAFRRITVLERPGDVPVRVRARGKAYWSAADGSGEQRRDALDFQGVRGR